MVYLSHIFSNKNWMKKFILAFAVILIGTSAVNAQQVTMSNGTVNACSGNFSDDGVGGPYSDTDYTMTICPDIPGNVVQLTFSAFALQVSPGNGQSDSFAIFDGPNTGFPSLGSYGGSDLQGFEVTGTVNNTTGCITLVFSANGPANVSSPGWEAAIACTIPCAPPTAASAITNPAPVGPEQTISVCIGEPVSFSDIGSFAEPGFNIVNYSWNFDDGVIEQGPNMTAATHTFDEAGEYIVTLTVTDNNGCNNLNIIPLQVLVSTVPLFTTLQDMTTCFGNEIELVGSAESVLWTALPPQVVAGTTYLADGAGFSYSTSLEFDIFEPDAVLETCDDLLGIVVNMEHSYMGDLGLSITCPNGTLVNLVTYPNGGGGTFLGEAIDNDPANDPGIGYTYTWDPDATNGTWGDNAGGGGFGDPLPAGSYEAEDNLCDLVGCPLNGTWTFSVTDNLAADNGYIFFWGINLNPELFPDVTTFLPTIGIDADSSYWTGPNIINADFNQDVITISPPGPGSYDYTYNVVNSFGCEYDTTITITFDQAPSITAGPDLLFNCNSITLQGGFQGIPTPVCSQDAGIFDYCYSNGEVFEWTFCPDNPGDGTVMTFSFIEGSSENFFDDFTIYDGPDNSSPIIEQGITGPLAGLSWTATNPDGCITIAFNADGSVDCANSGQTPWVYEVSCTSGGPSFTWEWTPAAILDNPSSPQPTISDLPQTTTFTLTGYPVGNPDCATTDQMVVTLDAAINPGTDSTYTFCTNQSTFNLIGKLGGNPNTTGTWTDPNGNPIAGTFNPATGAPGEYTYTITTPDCVASAVVTLEQITPITFTVPNDTTMCGNGQLSLYLPTVSGGQTPYNYQWSYNNQFIANTPSFVHTVQNSGQACMTITDICNNPITNCVDVTVEQPLTVDFTVDTTAACFPYIFYFENLINPALYEDLRWEMGDGTVVDVLTDFNHIYTSPGNYSVTLQLTSEIGCVYETTKTNYISVLAPPVAQFAFGPQPTDIREPEITFTDVSIGQIQNYLWTFNTPNILGYSNEQNPVFSFPSDAGGEFPVRLEVTDGNNCSDFYEAIIVINDIFQYYLPTAFTPNGDGINDVWKFEGADIDEKLFELVVFDRWGNKVFYSTDPTLVWDGGVNGSDYYSPNGIYNWIATVKSKATGDRKELQGTVLLMR
jgi:gliding motility-associated-like protein